MRGKGLALASRATVQSGGLRVAIDQDDLVPLLDDFNGDSNDDKGRALLPARAVPVRARQQNAM
jgi:hypothetical protein